MTTINRRQPLLVASPLHGGAAMAEGRAATQRQQAEAMAKLSTQRRQQYFAARRELEQNQSTQRLEALKQSESCVIKARDSAAVESCEKQFMRKQKNARSSQMDEFNQLQRRYNLPVWGGQRYGEKGSKTTDKPSRPSSNKGA